MLMYMPQMLDYAPRRRGWRPKPFTIFVSGLVFAGLLLGGFLIYQHLRRCLSGRSPRVSCAFNLRQIGLAMQLYANENHSAYSPNFELLITTQGLGIEVFACPSSGDTKATGNTLEEALGQLRQGSHCSYVYVGANLTDQSDAACVVAFDLPANHSMEGGNVLFSDAHVEWWWLPRLVQLIPALEAGLNPPPPPKPLTQAEALQVYYEVWAPQLTALKSGDWEKRVTGQLPASRPATTSAAAAPAAASAASDRQPAR
jgi:hypothetical protein